MSVIGSNFLDHIVDENIVSPAEILTKLNQSVINTLKQDDLKSESRDGMDVAICLIDITKNTITYAGANRPLYAVDSLGNCIETKGDKRPIGGLDNSLYKFSEHTFDLINNTNYYLFTDGFVDQFGGDKDKKFTTKRFKEILSSISKLPMNEQLIIIENAFVNWKTASAQTDDVLVIGFKVN
jgi:serine phosphatase RsbU (regulator of sigma subunit)